LSHSKNAQNRYFKSLENAAAIVGRPAWRFSRGSMKPLHLVLLLHITEEAAFLLARNQPALTPVNGHTKLIGRRPFREMRARRQRHAQCRVPPPQATPDSGSPCSCSRPLRRGPARRGTSFKTHHRGAGTEWQPNRVPAPSQLQIHRDAQEAYQPPVSFAIDSHVHSAGMLDRGAPGRYR